MYSCFLLLTQDFQRLLPCNGAKHDILRLGSLKLKPQESEEPWKPISGLPDSNQFVRIDTTVKSSFLTDVQGMQIIVFTVGHYSCLKIFLNLV